MLFSIVPKAVADLLSDQRTMYRVISIQTGRTDSTGQGGRRNKEHTVMNTAEISFLAAQFGVNIFVNENATVISNGTGTSLQMLHQVLQTTTFWYCNIGFYTCASYLSSL